MNRIKMVALDLDGTALDDHQKFTKRLKKAFEKSMEQGVHIVLCTGRVFSSLPEETFTIPGLEYIITSNGASITKLGLSEPIYETRIPPKQVEDIVALLQGRGFSVDALVKGDAYIDRREYEDFKENGSDFRSASYVLSTRKPVDGIFDFMLANKGELENINIVFREEADRIAMRKKLETLPDITVTSSFHNNIEVGGANTSKANALNHLMDKLDIRAEELMACGDSPNDLDMVQLAGIGVMMGNATDTMKAHADYVTDTNANDGVAKAMERFVLHD